MNCLELEKENVTLVNGDCLDPEIVELAEKDCVVFSDPARPPGSKERTLDEIVPDPRKVMTAYREKSSGMCFEIPPYISVDKVGIECEFEFLSLDGRVNRLNIYTGGLIRSERSAVVLPQGSVLKGSFTKVEGLRESDLRPGHLIYEVDPGVIRAGLEKELADDLNISPDFIHLDERRSMLMSPAPLGSPFLKQGFKILASSVKQEDLVRKLEEVDAGSVTLRYGVEPKDYWKVRRSLESKLKGSRKVQLFKGVDHLILEKI